jgi:choline dehydrogenase-like flavoprotein
MRGSASEYDAWSKFGGNQWNWAGLLDFFKKNEKYTAPIWGFDAIFPGITKGEDAIARSRESHFKGYTGPIEHTHNEIYTDALKPCILTLNKLGIKTNRSPVRDPTLMPGFSYYSSVQDYGNATGIFNIGTSVNRPSGKRSYAASAYLGPSLTKPKVMLLTRITATKIILKKEDDGDVTATGVECVYGDIILPPFTIMAKKVISSAGEPRYSSFLLLRNHRRNRLGAYNTPRLLELSGIGNPRIINELGISTVVDLPGVGENLQDHLFVPSDFIAKDGVFTLGNFGLRLRGFNVTL